MEEQTLHSMSGTFSIQTVADNRHAESVSGSGMDAKLVGAPGQRMELHAAPVIRHPYEFIIRDRLLPFLMIHPLSRTVEPVGSQRQLDPTLQ